MFCSSEHNVSYLVVACRRFPYAGSKSVVLVFQYVLRRVFFPPADVWCANPSPES